jgi:hypothetical protein
MLRMADTMTSKNIDLSSWGTLYIKEIFENWSKTNCISLENYKKIYGYQDRRKPKFILQATGNVSSC